jgi:hypothetical protein
LAPELHGRPLLQSIACALGFCNAVIGQDSHDQAASCRPRRRPRSSPQACMTPPQPHVRRLMRRRLPLLPDVSGLICFC